MSSGQVPESLGLATSGLSSARPPPTPCNGGGRKKWLGPPNTGCLLPPPMISNPLSWVTWFNDISEPEFPQFVEPEQNQPRPQKAVHESRCSPTRPLPEPLSGLIHPPLTHCHSAAPQRFCSTFLSKLSAPALSTPIPHPPRLRKLVCSFDPALPLTDRTKYRGNSWSPRVQGCGVLLGSLTTKSEAASTRSAKRLRPLVAASYIAA